MEREMTASNPTDRSSDGIQKKQPGGRTCGPTRRSTKGQWTAEEDDILCKAVQRFKGKNWKKIAECFKDRTDVQCLHRWQKVLNPELVKGPWSKEEDEMIIELVNKFGAKKWSTIAQYLPGRIGKQCRERWHNHLNPAINKDAWTQEEELILIRAHQSYGNKWAELTKFLPGRSDNAIKNHWNSSVKKKLDSYLASGLLDQWQGLPLVALQNKPMNPSLSRRQSNGDESGARGGAEAEESECSQSSAFRSYSQSASDLPNEVEYANEHVQMSIMPCGMEEQSLIPVSCSETCYPSFEDVQFSIPEFPCEAEYASKFPDQNFSHDAETSTTLNCKIGQQDQQFSSMEFATLCIPSNGSQEAMTGTSQTLVDERSPLFVANTDAVSQTPSQMLISDEECCRALFSETANNEHYPSGILVQGPHVISSLENKAPLLCQSSDGFIYPDESCNSLGGIDHSCISDLPGNSYLLKDTYRLVPMDSFPSPPKVPISSSIDGKPAEQGTQGLCYEPPRFPSMEVPFLSCDLVQSNCDLQQEYSPLGIRQLMMSSANCLTPFRLWDDSSPDAVLKSAAKTFTGTPSILKKRQRSLFSPLSDRRKDKKLETDIVSTLAKGFPRLDVSLDECKNNSSHPSQSPEQRNKSNASSEAKENQGHALESVRQEDAKDIASVRNNQGREETLELRNSEGVRKEVASETNTMEKDKSDLVQKESSGALVQRENTDQQLFSLGKTDSKADKALIWSVKTPISLSKRLLASPKQGVSAIQSAHTGNTVDNGASSVGIDNHCIFGGTPFRRIIESPSFWKSPLYFNSFLPSPKFDTEITIEDMRIFMSPGDKSYDALGLMKQLSKHSAAAYADALEVLGDDTPETILRKRQLSKLKQDKENNQQTNALVERRTLDFSDCGTPGKGKSSSAAAAASKGFSSPSSYLLKSCR